MQEYNYTGTSTGDRPLTTYSFTVPAGYQNTIPTQRLKANGTNAITGITFDGYSYNWDLLEGKPSRLTNVTNGEVLQVTNGVVDVILAAGAMCIMNFKLA